MKHLEKIGFNTLEDFVIAAKDKGIKISVGGQEVQDYLKEEIISIIEDFLFSCNYRGPK